MTHARSGGYCCRHTRIVKENTAEQQESSMLEMIDDMLEPLSWMGTMKMEHDLMDLSSIDWTTAVDDILTKSTGWTHVIGNDDWY